MGPVRPLVHELAQQLPRDDVSIRGVALLELLISSPMSALYGREPERLKREVGRVRYLLSHEPRIRPSRGEPPPLA